MPNPRQKHLMQKALDEQLAPEEQHELHQYLDNHAKDADLFRRIKKVDTMLQDAPHERAPQGLAATIMSRLADMAEQMDPRQLSRISGLALALGLGLTALAIIPLLAGVIWLVLTLLGTVGLTALVQALASVIGALVSFFSMMIDNVQSLLASRPELFAIMLGLIPVSLFWLARSWQRSRATHMP